MNKSAFFTLMVMLFSCNHHNNPEVSHIIVNIEIERFDKFVFENFDTTAMQQSVAGMQSAFPHFTNDFITHILGLPEINPSAIDSATSIAFSEIKRYIKLTKPLYDSLSARFAKTEQLKNELILGFKHVKYYFAGYKVPKVLTYVGPFDAPGVAITDEAIAIGLQLFAGRDFSFYGSPLGQELFPLYISRRFEPAYITINCMKAIAEDLYPDKSRGRPLIEQMIEKGKQWWLVGKFLPLSPDTLKTGYTLQQLNWCRENEGLIWNFVLQSNDIYTTEPSLTNIYIGEAPSTQGMPEASPGNIGQWIGWRIIEKYAAKNPDLKLDDVLQTDAKKILADSKYKPR